MLGNYEPMATETYEPIKAAELIAAGEVEDAPVEEAKVDEAISTVSEHSPDVQAVMFLKPAIKEFTEMCYGESAAVLRRVFARLMQDPFEETPFVPTMGKDGELYLLASQIINAKFILFQTALESKLNKQIAADVANNATDVANNEQGELNG